MKRWWVLGLWLSWCTVSGLGQDLPKKGYLHLTGHTGDGREVTMELVKINDSLYCDVTIGVAKGEAQGREEPRWAGGRIGPDGSFTLRDPLDADSPVWSGRFISRQSVTGTLKPGRDGASQPFTLSERYPAGSSPLNVYYMKATRPLIKNPKSPKAVLEACLVVPGESGNTLVSDSVKNLIIRQFAGKTTLSRDPDTVLSAVRDRFFTEYRESNDDLVKQMGLSPTMNWALDRLVHIVCNEQKILSWYVMSYAYTGGAHGLEMLEYCVANATTGRRLLPADIFTEGSAPALTGLLTAELKKKNGLDAGAKLLENGYFTEEVAPCDNIFLTPYGVGFCYNPYDIAPYSSGRTVIFLPWASVSPFLRPGVLPDGFIR